MLAIFHISRSPWLPTSGRALRIYTPPPRLNTGTWRSVSTQTLRSYVLRVRGFYSAPPHLNHVLILQSSFNSFRQEVVLSTITGTNVRLSCLALNVVSYYKTICMFICSCHVRERELTLWTLISFAHAMDIPPLNLFSKWNPVQGTSLHQCQISHANNNITIIHDKYRGFIDITRSKCSLVLITGRAVVRLEKAGQADGLQIVVS